MLNRPMFRSVQFPHRIRPTLLPLCVLVLLLSQSGCGFGSAAVAGSAGDSQGNTSPVVGVVTVVDPNTPTLRAATSPAAVSFRLTDAEGDLTSVSIDYSTDDGVSYRPITTPTTLTGLAPGDYKVVWNYAGDLDGTSFRTDVKLRVTAAGGNSELASPFDIGNDAAEIDSTAFVLPGDDTEGTVQIGFHVKDSSGDLVDIHVEFNRDAENGFPDTSWRTARSVGVPASDPTPSPALRNLEASASGINEDFFWESDFDPPPVEGVSEQMPSIDSEVKLRFSAVDEFSDFSKEGPWAETSVFRVDNNAVPRAVLNEISFLGVKDRGNIPLRFRIIDREADDVQVAIQWTSSGQAFPLARNRNGQLVNLADMKADELKDLLEEPTRDQDRRDAQVAREAPPVFQGRLGESVAGQLDDQVRLPEVAGSQAGLRAMGIVGRTLEILRPAQPAAASWSATALNSPVDAHVLEQGRTALVLDRAGSSGGWQVREIDLETGVVERTVASGSGTPKSMDVDPMNRTLFVASSTQIVRYMLQTGAQLGDAMSNSFSDGPRSLAALGDQVVLATGDSVLRRFDFSPNSSRQDEIMLSGLATPWGLALDPLRTTAVYLAESGFDNGSGPHGRVVSVNLDQLVLEPIPALIRQSDEGTLSATAFPGVKSIALEDSGRELLAVTEWNNSAGLRRLALRSPWDPNQPAEGQAAPFVEQVAVLNESVGGLATGPDRLRIVTLPAASLLMIGGGVAQRRSIQAYNSMKQVVTLDRDLNPVPADGAATEWRVRTPLREPSGSPTGRPFAFVWDSTEIPDPASVKLRVIAQDIDPGIPGTSALERSYRPSFDPVSPKLSAPDMSLRPRSTTTADLDGDGDMDLVSVNEVANNLTMYYQKRPGVFERNASTWSTGGSPRHVIAADLNNDGDVDLVTANFTSDDLTLLIQTDSGGYTQHTLNLPSGAEPWAVTAADFDTDGKIDLAVANSGLDTLSLFWGTTSGLFDSPATSLSTGTEPRSVIAADLDGDGDLDLASANHFDDTLSLFLQTTSGNFDQTSTLLSTGDGPHCVTAGDLDRDGDMDLVTAVDGDDELWLFRQTTPGVFEYRESLTTGRAPRSVAAADLDGDGDLDLVAANAQDEDLTLYFQTGPGIFKKAGATLPSRGLTESVIAADLDGDGDMDLVSSNYEQNELAGGNIPLQLLFQANPGSFTGIPVSLEAGQWPFSVTAADLDGDGDLDLVSANLLSGDLKPLLQTGPGVFSPRSALPSGQDNTQDDFVAVVAADLDGDGDLDLASTSSRESTLRVYSQASGEFTQTQAVNAGIFMASVTAADLNGDGRIDLVTANRESNDLAIFFQDPGGGFPTNPTFLSVNKPVCTAAADLDGDGDMDLVSVSYIEEKLTLFLQDAQGNFTRQSPTLDTGSAPRQVVAADLDSDGDMDLVTANFLSGNLTLHFQTAPGVFDVQPVTLVSGNGCVSVAAADLDGDGDMDLVSVNEEASSMKIWFQTSPGGFTESPATLSPGQKPIWVTAADLDGDGDLDLVTANRSTETLTLLFNGK